MRCGARAFKSLLNKASALILPLQSSCVGWRFNRPSTVGPTNARGPAVDLDCTHIFQLVSVKVENLDFPLDHALNQNFPAVPPPNCALAPMAVFDLGHRNQLRPAQAVYFNNPWGLKKGKLTALSE